jgi:hypothetical protein
MLFSDNKENLRRLRYPREDLAIMLSACALAAVVFFGFLIFAWTDKESQFAFFDSRSVAVTQHSIP